MTNREILRLKPRESTAAQPMEEGAHVAQGALSAQDIAMQLRAAQFEEKLGVLQRHCAHLAQHSILVEVRLDTGAVWVPVQIIYSPHCTTRSRKEGDEDEDVLYRESRSGGFQDERVFCERRWEFSKSLPQLMAGLATSLCLQGGRREIFYRVKSDVKNPKAGWYVCGRLDTSAARQEIQIQIRSAHHRDNRPNDVRNGPRRFWALFREFYLPMRNSHNWAVALEKPKP